MGKKLYVYLTDIDAYELHHLMHEFGFVDKYFYITSNYFHKKAF